ncbi:MAG: acetyl-CoA carboxylase biotin carboxyl carrier protein [Ignavibacteria bacterium]|nr:acetyl-CoA carboxylase biotin carboxyl carrier protein [Ignavibacteria bacterium]
MDLNYLKKLIRILDTSNVAEMEIEEEGTKIKLSKPKQKIIYGTATSGIPVAHANFHNENNVNEATEDSIKVEISKADLSLQRSENLIEVKSPMVGTYYQSPSADADAYVKIGSDVSSGTVLCIIEAMKLMNEIESEVSGKITKILVENGQPVEYNQPLFLIEKD